eukprot:TRINITY_DN647_c0_g1_i1.p1 TRINITY_DN647_c0_g1~~TRINITY_DN647_c0_g1_i1.p1  ORF type:complete len:283 (+),score=43.90 TRINITY_DN647_c0_g1_i1:37-885(+)
MCIRDRVSTQSTGIIPMALSWRSVHSALVHSFTPRGFDLFLPLSIEKYNQQARSGAHKVPLPEKRASNCLGVVVGNTKLIWPNFLSFYSKVQQERYHGTSYSSYHLQNPFYHYIEETLSQVTPSLKSLLQTEEPLVHYFHKPISERILPNEENLKDKDGWSSIFRERYLPAQRIAEATGYIQGFPEFGLCVSEIYGPWITFRALLIFPQITTPSDIHPLDNSNNLLRQNEHHHYVTHFPVKHLIPLSEVARLENMFQKNIQNSGTSRHHLKIMVFFIHSLFF